MSEAERMMREEEIDPNAELKANVERALDAALLMVALLPVFALVCVSIF